MPRSRGLELIEIGPLEMVLALADAIESEGQRVRVDAGPLGSDDLACATEYMNLCHETAEGIRKTIERHERRVQRHLEGSCTNH